MTTGLSVTITQQTFDTKQAEVAYLIKCLQQVEYELGSQRGNATSGNIVHGHPNGQTQSLGMWTYTASASKP